MINNKNEFTFEILYVNSGTKVYSRYGSTEFNV